MLKPSAFFAWEEYGEIIYCKSREEAVEVSNNDASEHLQVQADDLDWWLAELKNYGCLWRQSI